MIVQIYEVNDPEEALILARIGVDHIGVLVGKGKFPREVGFDRARDIFRSLPPGTKKVALTLARDLEDIIELVGETRPDILHIGTLHENILPADVWKLKDRFQGLDVMRTVAVTGGKNIETAKSYERIADWLLLDTHRDGDDQIGATGETHDWEVSRRIVESVRVPVILAGGLGPDNVSEAIRKVHPAGVDSKTKTDRAGGKGKDIGKVKKFIEAARSSA